MTTPTQPVKTKALAPIDEIRNSLASNQDQLKRALPNHISVEKFTRTVVTALQINPDLATVDRQSLFLAILKCAGDGLLPDGREAAIVQFKGKAQHMPMVAGICKKARNSGEIKMLDAQVVYENDEYSCWTDELGPHFKHVRARGERGEPILTFAYAITRDGGVFHEEIDEAQMASIEKSSRAQNGPWAGPFRDEMKRKSAIKRLAKYKLPSSTDLDEVLKSDAEMFTPDEKEEQQAKEVPKAPSRLKAVLGAAEAPSPAQLTPPNEELPV